MIWLVRLNTEPRSFLLQAYTLCYAFTFASFHPGRLSYLQDPAALARMAIPAISGMLMLLIRDAQAASEGRSQGAATIDVSLVLAAAVVSQALAGHFRPNLALPRWVPTQGGMAGLGLLMCMRALLPPDKSYAQTAVCVSGFEIQSKAKEFNDSFQQTTNLYLTAAFAAILGAVFYIATGAPRVRTASALILAGSAWLIWRIRGIAALESFPADAEFDRFRSYARAQLSRRFRLLRDASRWYYVALLPGLVLFLLGRSIYSYIWLPVLLLVAELNHREATEIQHQVLYDVDTSLDWGDEIEDVRPDMRSKRS